jgi:uncharacterized protein YjbI with pentapeptide repeats
MSRDALVVGINTYSYERLSNLTAPAWDAEAMAQLLEKYGDFKVTRLPAVKDKQNDIIRVGQKTQVTLIQLEDAIVQLFKPGGQPPDTALLYFSGHGLRKSRGIQEGFLATSDVKPDLGNWGLSLQWLRRLLQESEVRQQIIILDCCYAGEVLNFAEADPGDRGKGRDRCFIAASRSFEVAYVEINNQHSVLTAALIKGLEPKQERWVTNYTLVDLLNQEQHAFPQRPIFANSGEPINLTHRWTAGVKESAALGQAICPYKGLAYFDCIEEDAKYFYGRTALTDELLEKVRLGNFLAVLGASGSGKSSVVRAGLLYYLKLGQRLSSSDKWQIHILQPGEHPLQNLSFTFVDINASAVERAKQLEYAEALIAQGATGLRRLVQASPQRVVLVIDQFEEVFTLCRNETERQEFFACLLGALEQTGNQLCLILAMRADFFGKCVEQDYSGLANQIQQHLVTVTPMTTDELRQAIVEPAKRVELEIEPELVMQMLLDVADAPGSLPLLQYTLMELWKQRSNNWLRLNTYAQLGGVMGTLRKRATAVYESFPDIQQAATRHIFLSLTQLGEGTEDTRRRVLKPDLVNERFSEEIIDQVIQRLADEKLIVTSELLEKGQMLSRVSVVDVTHEALIRHWQLLRKWLEENRDSLRQQRRIEDAAEEWRSFGKSKDYLLQGRVLSNAIAFQKEQSGKLTLSRLGNELIKESIRRKWNNLVRLIGFGLLTPVCLAIFLGITATQEIRLRQLRIAAGEAKGSERIRAVEQLVQFNVDISGINLKDANLENADLRGAKLRKANLKNANLSGANLRDANLSDANLTNADLNSAILINADLSFTKLIKATLIGVDARNANFILTVLSGANLSNARLDDAKFRVDFSGVNLQEANLENAKIQPINSLYFCPSKYIDNSGKQNCRITPFNKEVNLVKVQLSKVNLSGFDLSNLNLSNASLPNVNLTNANLTGSNLNTASLEGANLTNTILDNTDLSSSNLRGANLENISFSDTNFKGAGYNIYTKFPPNFNPIDKQMVLDNK